MFLGEQYLESILSRYVGRCENHIWPTIRKIEFDADKAQQKGPVRTESDFTQILTSEKRTLISGPPGSGKSTLISKIAVHMAGSALKGPTKWTPIVVELRSARESLLTHIHEILISHCAQKFENFEHFKKTLLAESFLFLFDGINEVRNLELAHEILHFSELYSNSHMLFTTRHSQEWGDLSIQNKFALEDFSEEQAVSFVNLQRISEQKSESIKFSIKHSRSSDLRSFLRKPYLLKLLCEFIKHSKAPADSIVNTTNFSFGTFFRTLLLSHESKIRPAALFPGTSNHWRGILEYLAFYMISAGGNLSANYTISRHEAHKLISKYFHTNNLNSGTNDAVQILNELISIHLLHLSHFNTIEFPHQLMQEYYAAEYLIQKYEALTTREFQEEFANKTKWTVPLEILCGLLDSQSKYIHLCKTAIQVDLRLAARIASCGPIAWRSQVCDLFSELSITADLFISLVKISNARNVTGLLEAKLPSLSDRGYAAVDSILRREDSIERYRFLRKIRKIRPPLLRKKALINLFAENFDADKPYESRLFILALKANDEEVRTAAAWTLKRTAKSFTWYNSDENCIYENKYKAIVNLLISSLSDPSPSVLRWILDGLSWMEHQESIHYIPQFYDHWDATTKAAAISTLSGVYEYDASAYYYIAMEDPDDEIRGRAAYALGEAARKPSDAEALLKLIDAEDGRAAILAIHGLEKGYVGITGAMLDRYNSSNDWVMRLNLLGAACASKGRQAFNFLCHLIRDERISLREFESAVDYYRKTVYYKYLKSLWSKHGTKTHSDHDLLARRRVQKIENKTYSNETQRLKILAYYTLHPETLIRNRAAELLNAYVQERGAEKMASEKASFSLHNYFSHPKHRITLALSASSYKGSATTNPFLSIVVNLKSEKIVNALEEDIAIPKIRDFYIMCITNIHEKWAESKMRHELENGLALEGLEFGGSLSGISISLIPSLNIYANRFPEHTENINRIIAESQGQHMQYNAAYESTPTKLGSTSMSNKSKIQFDVALSFAGEDRRIAEDLHLAMKKLGLRSFYDIEHQADLLGENLIDKLASIYGELSHFCLMLISENYIKKAWTNHERIHAQARQFRGQKSYILPVKLDNTEVPGLPITLGYLDLREHDVETVAKLIWQKVSTL